MSHLDIGGHAKNTPSPTYMERKGISTLKMKMALSGGQSTALAPIHIMKSNKRSPLNSFILPDRTTKSANPRTSLNIKLNPGTV